MDEHHPNDIPEAEVETPAPDKPNKRMQGPRKPVRTPLERAVQRYAAEFDPETFAERLLVELAAVGITEIDQVESHRLGDIRRAIAACFRHDAHSFYAVVAKTRE